LSRVIALLLAVLTAVTALAFFASYLPSLPLGLWSIRESLGPATYDPVMAILIGVLLLAAFFSAEATKLDRSKEVALVSSLVALGAAGRLLFAAAPNISPVDWLTLCTGMVFGPLTGFSVGAATMLVSNFWLGQGPWTIYQMIGMGLLGVLGGVLHRWRSSIGAKAMGGIGFGWAFVYGTITSVFWVLFFASRVNWTGFAAYWVAGLPFYVLQGLGNAVLLYILGRRTLAIFERYRKRLIVTYEQITLIAEAEAHDV